MNYKAKKSLATLLLVASTQLWMGNSCESDRVRRMNEQQQAVEIVHSVERENINKRLKIANDPNQIMWIYGLSDAGNVPIFYSPLVGKVTSSTKRLEPSHIAGQNSTIGYVAGEQFSTDEIMGADGTYGSSDPYVYWFTPEGQYLQWNGKYILSSIPLKFDKPILNVSDIDYVELQKGQKAREALKANKKVNNKLEAEE